MAGWVETPAEQLRKQISRQDASRASLAASELTIQILQSLVELANIRLVTYTRCKTNISSNKRVPGSAKCRSVFYLQKKSDKNNVNQIVRGNSPSPLT